MGLSFFKNIYSYPMWDDVWFYSCETFNFNINDDDIKCDDNE